MHGDVAYDDRVVGKGLVEMIAIEQIALRHDVLVVTVGLNQFAGRDLLLVRNFTSP